MQTLRLPSRLASVYMTHCLTLGTCKVSVLILELLDVQGELVYTQMYAADVTCVLMFTQLGLRNSSN